MGVGVDLSVFDVTLAPLTVGFCSRAKYCTQGAFQIYLPWIEVVPIGHQASLRLNGRCRATHLLWHLEDLGKLAKLAIPSLKQRPLFPPSSDAPRILEQPALTQIMLKTECIHQKPIQETLCTNSR